MNNYKSSLRCLDAAFRNFFDGQCAFPEFKRRKNKKSFTIQQDIRLDGDKFRLWKFPSGIKVIAHTPVIGKIKKYTVLITASVNYYVSIVSEEEYQPMKKTGKSVGIDLGIKTLVTTSDGSTFDNHKYTRENEKKLANAKRHLSRKVKGSASYERQRIEVAKIHEKITNSRKDYHHKISHQLLFNYDLVAIEDLAVKDMITNRRFSKGISDSSWGTLSRFIEYKAKWNHKQVVKVNRYFPSSQKCNLCGCINHDLTLDMRKWTCINGHELDRDINAAQNILEEGIKIINTSSGTGDYTDGDLSKTFIRKRKSVKSGTTHSLL